MSNLQDNDEPGSLRHAVDAALPKSTITFSASLRGTILLTSGDLTIAKDLIIRGPGEGILSISSGTSGHIIRVVQGVTVTISGLTFKDSKNSNSVTGFIDNKGTLTLSNSTVLGNTASRSGGTYTNGILGLSNSSGGGGISNEGTLTLSNSTVSGNTAVGGGGIVNSSPPTTTTTTTITTNIINSTISDNKASSDGGGILIQSSIPSKDLSTIIQANLTFSTIFGNTANGSCSCSGDIEIEDEVFSSDNGKWGKPSKQVSQVKVRNSIVAGDPAHGGPDIVGMLTSSGYNLFQDNSGATFDPATRTQHGTDKTLSVNDVTRLFASPVGLRENGGPTKTYALLPDTSNPALNKVPLDACHITIPIKDVSSTSIAQYTITTDQRGTKRPDGNEQFCDIGAYEYTD